MKNRASLLLMEQLLMVLVFALAAAVCLGCFVKAADISARTAHRRQAAVLAQNAVETIKAGGDPEALPVPEGYEVRVLQNYARESVFPQLYAADVEVFYEGESLFFLSAVRQDGMP